MARRVLPVSSAREMGIIGQPSSRLSMENHDKLDYLPSFHIRPCIINYVLQSKYAPRDKRQAFTPSIPTHPQILSYIMAEGEKSSKTEVRAEVSIPVKKLAQFLMR